MELKQACINILEQTAETINSISEKDFVTPLDSLHGSTLGQHFRHAIEFFQCLRVGSDAGEVCYDNRAHDKQLETRKALALAEIRSLQQFILGTLPNQPLTLVVSYNPETNETVHISSNMAREITYNIEHLVHHMALVKIGLKEADPGLQVPEDFGVAISTIKYHRNLS